jgi:hypothetical protein
LVIEEKGDGGLDITAIINFVYVLPSTPLALKIAIVDLLMNAATAIKEIVLRYDGIRI